jgi:hypothetical protein
MLRFEVAMNGSAQKQIIEVEDLLRKDGATHAANDNVFTAPRPSRRFDSRPLVAGFLAFFVFAPGCAAATVFLMRADGNIPPVIQPDRNPPFVAKADRLPLDMWGADAAEMLGIKDNVRVAAAAAAVEDPAFLAPFLIRGSLEDGTLTTISDSVPAADPIASAPKPRLKREARRTRPARTVVAEAAPVEPPQPSFFEKLFGSLSR